MEPKTTVEIQLSTGPGAENQAKFGAEDGVGFVARIDGGITVDVKDEDIPPQTEHGTHLGEPLRLVLVIEAYAGFVHLVIPCGADTVALQRLKQGDLGNSIVADLQPDGMIHRGPEPGGEPGLGHVPPDHEPPIRLLELIAVDGIIEEKGEVGKQIETVIDQIGVGLVRLLSPLCDHSLYRLKR